MREGEKPKYPITDEWKRFVDLAKIEDSEEENFKTFSDGWTQAEIPGENI